MTSFTVGRIRIVYTLLAALRRPHAFRGGTLTCSNWAVYEPFLSHNGGYASTMPLFTRLFNCSGLAAVNQTLFAKVKRCSPPAGTSPGPSGPGSGGRTAGCQSSC